MTSETTPLVGSQPTAYFLDGAHRRNTSNTSYAASATGEEVNNMPAGAVVEEFNPRPLTGRAPGSQNAKPKKMRSPSIGGGWLGYIADMGKTKPYAPNPEDAAASTGEIGTLLLPRKVPVKVEPKVHMANERTFLAWLHVVVILAGASVTIVTYSRNDVINQLYGVVLLPVSVAFIFYALYQYLRRTKMIRQKEPGPYVDIVGPTTLTVILMASIMTQFFVKLHAFMYD
mmetsp:Transcript_25288/g.53336  ORF Transcript_25288/g.53336 Transcript_25288/m.53336 type:complete len:229 (+) Transcript_25288:145-831(+)